MHAPAAAVIHELGAPDFDFDFGISLFLVTSPLPPPRAIWCVVLPCGIVRYRPMQFVYQYQ